MLLFNFRSESRKWIHAQLDLQHNMCLHTTKFTHFITLTETKVIQLATQYDNIN